MSHFGRVLIHQQVQKNLKMLAHIILDFDENLSTTISTHRYYFNLELMHTHTELC